MIIPIEMDDLGPVLDQLLGNLRASTIIWLGGSCLSWGIPKSSWVNIVNLQGGAPQTLL